jgi:hypothetical protein
VARLLFVVAGGVFFREISVVLGFHFPAVILRDIPASEDPVATESGETSFHITLKSRVPPRAARVIDPERFVDLDSSIGMVGLGEVDFTKRDGDSRVEFPRKINTAAVWKDIRDRAGRCGSIRFVWRDHRVGIWKKRVE